MRTVIIVQDCTDKRQWVAMDSKSGARLLRLQERYQLEAVCIRLGWTFAAPKPKLTNAAKVKRRVSARGKLVPPRVISRR
jgi:hypothetical protein